MLEKYGKCINLGSVSNYAVVFNYAKLDLFLQKTEVDKKSKCKHLQFDAFLRRKESMNKYSLIVCSGDYKNNPGLLWYEENFLVILSQILASVLVHHRRAQVVSNYSRIL